MLFRQSARERLQDSITLSLIAGCFVMDDIINKKYIFIQFFERLDNN